MKKIKIVSVVGARPNFVKICPFLRELKKHKGMTNILVHTGQHYTDYMSDFFFKDFKMGKYISLNVGSAARITQIAKIIKKLKKILEKEKPDLVVVVGDVNSTLAGAFCAKRLGIKVAHIESGLRSFDKSMPEEINRVLTDSISDFLFTTEPQAEKNLKQEGIAQNRIFFVGNIMIDSLIYYAREAKKKETIRKLRLQKTKYGVLTLHRPKNVDNKKRFKRIINALIKIQKDIKIVYPIHPRAIKMARKFGFLKLLENQRNLLLIKPLGYIDFLNLMTNSKFVITDSGGMQEETTYLGIPCFTLRENTERPITVNQGTNVIIGEDYSRLTRLVRKIGTKKRRKKPKFWDGNTAKRIVKILERHVA